MTRTEILKHARQIDDRIQLARKILKEGQSTAVTEAVGHLLRLATESYFDLNDAALKLPYEPVTEGNPEAKS